MLFSCLPSGLKCEWHDLRSLVQEYNRLNCTDYERTACLDVEIRDSVQPELLLEYAGHQPVVIERKTITCGQSSMSHHGKLHTISSTAASLLSPMFKDAPYQLYIFDADLDGYSSRQARDLAAQISRIVLSSESALRAGVSIQGTKPIRFKFRKLLPAEVDGDTPSRGVGVVARLRDDPDDIESARHAAILGFSKSLVRAVAAATVKFQRYARARKILAVQFVGDDSYVVDDDLLAILHSPNLFGQVDEVWYAFHQWTSECDYELGWRRAV
jgi:hypothetical protein